MYIVTVIKVDGLGFQFQHPEPRTLLSEAAKLGYFLVDLQSQIDHATKKPMKDSAPGQRLLMMHAISEISYEEERNIIRPASFDAKQLGRAH